MQALRTDVNLHKRSIVVRKFITVFTATTVASLGMTACGGNNHKPKPPGPVQVSKLCQPNHSFMGCASGVAARPPVKFNPKLRRVTPPVPGCKFPDVSDWQGHPNWWAAVNSICAGVAKAGEGFSEDPDFAWNVGVLRSLHIPWSGYWFIRGCDEGSSFVSILNSVGFREDKDALRPVLDMEVSSAYNCAVPMANAIWSAFHVWPIIYTAPGTWPGGSNGGLALWVASYGVSHAPCIWTCSIAWQFASPPYVYFYIPGIGYQDVSVDINGFAKAYAFPGPPPPPPDPYKHFPNVPIKTPYGVLREYWQMQKYVGARAHSSQYAAYLKVLEAHGRYFAARVYYLACHGHKTCNWGAPNKEEAFGPRFSWWSEVGRGQVVHIIP